jgi:serine/threonine-protein kinase
VNDDQLVWVDRTGRASPIDSSWRGRMRSPALAPDGSRLAVTVGAGTGTKIFVKQLPSGPRTLVSQSARENGRPRWTPDSRRVAFLAGSGVAELGVSVRRFDASDAGESLLPPSRNVNEIDFTPDGRTLVYRTGNLLGTRDILRFTPGTDSAPRMLLGGAQDDYGPAISPDGKWLAYVSTESGRAEVSVRRLADPTSGRTPVSVDGGAPPVWSRSGRELFFQGSNGRTMYVADVRTGPTFSAGTPRVLFESSSYRWDAFSRAFDVSVDDRRFLMVLTPKSEQNEMVLVLNLTATLRARGTSTSP